MPELSDYNGLFALEFALGVPKIYNCIAATETWPEWLGETDRYKFVVAFLCARVSCYRRRVELGCCFGVIPTDSVIGTASGQFYHRPNMPVRIGRPVRLGRTAVWDYPDRPGEQFRYFGYEDGWGLNPDRVAFSIENIQYLASIGFMR